MLRAVMDQAGAVMRDVAPALAEFWKSLVENGMSEGAATVVVSDWFQVIVKRGMGQE